MLLVASKIVVFLLLAALIGAVIGWWFARSNGRREVEAAERRARDAMTSVHADLQNRETRLRDVRSKLSDAETKIIELERQNAHLSTRRSTSSVVDDEKSRIIRSLNEELSVIRQRAARIEAGALAWQEHSDAVHEAEFGKVAAQLRTLTAERDRLLSELETARVDVKSANSTIVELQPMHAKLQSAAARIGELEAYVAQQRVEQERLQRELAVLAKARDSLEARDADIAQLKSQLNDARADLGVARKQLTQIGELQAQANQATARLRTAEIDLQAKDRESEKLRAHILQVERVAVQVPELDRLASDLKAQLSRAQSNLQASEKEVKARMEDLTRLRTELIQNSVAGKRIPELERQLTEANMQRASDAERLQASETESKAAHEQITRLRSELEAASAAAVQVPQLERQLMQSLERNALDQQRITALEAGSAAHDQTLVRMQTDLAIMQGESSRAAELERALQDVRTQSAREAERQKTLEADLRNALAEVARGRESIARVTLLEQELAAERARAAEQQSAFADATRHAARLPELEIEVANAREQLARDSVRANALEQELTRLRAQLDSFAGIAQRMEQREIEISALAGDLDAARESLRDSDLRASELRVSLAGLEANEAALRSEIDRLREAARPPARERRTATAAVAHDRRSASRTQPKDDLKLIRGVGPVLEKLLNKHGVRYFAQVAQWTKADIERMADVLPNFHTRITRENWMKSAREEHIKKYGRLPTKE